MKELKLKEFEKSEDRKIFSEVDKYMHEIIDAVNDIDPKKIKAYFVKGTKIPTLITGVLGYSTYSMAKEIATNPLFAIGATIILAGGTLISGKVTQERVKKLNIEK